MRQLRTENVSITQRDDETKAYLAMIRAFKPLTIEEEVMLANLGTPKAKEKLINHNLLFVVSVAKQYNYCRGTLTLLDLIQAGNEGLIEAVNDYDVTVGVKVCSFAVFYIRKSIIKCLQNNSRTVRDKRLGVTDTPNINQSLDAPMYDDNDMTFADVLCTDNPIVDNTTHNQSLANDFCRIFAKILTHKEMIIIAAIFGINTQQKSMYELSLEMGCSEERIRQIKMSSITKIQMSPKATQLLAKYL